MSLNWLKEVNKVQAFTESIKYEYDLAHVYNAEASARVQAAMALALDAAVENTGLSRRRKRRLVEKMKNLIMSGGCVTYLMGYDTAKKEGG